MGKLIMIMIDGVSAEHFEAQRHKLPFLNHLAKTGSQVSALAPEMCGTSMPGRTSIITGESPAVHGIYANNIYDQEQSLFRWSNPYDLLCKPLPEYATEQGKDVVNLGYGMVKPEDCSIYYNPWWVGEMLMRGKDQEPTPSDKNWLRAGKIVDPEGRLEKLIIEKQLDRPITPSEDPENLIQRGMLADQQHLDLAAALATSDQKPDLIMLEIGITDYYFHKYGVEHPLSELSLRIADQQVGSLIKNLEDQGSLDEYNFLILADHGHTAMPKGMYIDNLLPSDTVWSSEGGVLLVLPKDQEEADLVTEKLKAEGIESWNNDHIPTPLKDIMLTFVVPEDSDISFEKAKNGSKDLFGPSKYQSNHGMRPGRKEDFRFCIFNGPDIASGKILPEAPTISIAPTMAKILGVSTEWEAEPLSIF